MPDVINSEWGEQIKLHDLHLEGPFEGCRITKLIMHVAPSEHASMRIEAKLKLSEAKEWIYRELDGIPVTVKTIEGCIMFCGPIRNASISVSGGSCRIALELTSGSRFLDLKEASCSYQDGNISYRQIMKETIQEIEGGAIIFPGIGEEVTGQPIIRYLETAWAFLTRLASHKGVPLVPDIHTTGAPRIFAGLPRIPEQSIMWEDRQIIQIHQDGRFLSLGGYEAGLDPLHFLMYDICDSKMFQIGQRGIIRGREMVVVGVDARSYGGEVVFNYHVAMEQYCYVPRQNNHKISGMSLLGTVIGRAAEDIWLHLDIDGDRGSADNWGWPWTPPTGNFMYLMPKEGSRVSLYFSNADERSGKGINCIAQTSGGNPRERWLKTEHKKSLNLKEEEMSLVSENGGNSIKMYGTGVYFKGQEITLSGKSINIDGSKVKLKANVDTILIGVGPMEEGKEGGCQLEPTAFVGLTKDELDICGKARTLLDAEAGSEGNPPYPDGPQEGKWNFAKAAGRAAVTVVVIGGTAVVVCASMGASTPVIAGAAVTAGMAGGGMMVSDAIQGKVSSLEDYALSVASAELMFFTNQAMTHLITVTGMGFVSGTVAKAAGEAAAGAALDYLVEGEVDYERLARNLAINVVVDLGTGVLTGEAWEKPRQRTVEGGSGALPDTITIRNIKKTIADSGISENEFLTLMRKSSNELTLDEAKILENIRKSVPFPDSTTPLQKVLNPSHVEGYLDGSFMNFNDGKIGGCITTVDDASGLKSPKGFYEGLRLDYDGTPFSPSDGSATIIRFTSNETSNIKIPFGEGMPEPTGGKVSSMAPPFTGNGFTSATNGQIIPEFYSDGLTINNGAQMIEITSEGKEILKAVYDAKQGLFVLVD